MAIARKIRILTTACGLLLLAPGASLSAEPGLQPGETGTVVEIVDGYTLMLDNGIEVRLVGLQAPKLPLGRRGFAAWPPAAVSKQALHVLAMG